jgi:hypothetical protein
LHYERQILKFFCNYGTYIAPETKNLVGRLIKPPYKVLAPTVGTVPTERRCKSRDSPFASFGVRFDLFAALHEPHYLLQSGHGRDTASMADTNGSSSISEPRERGGILQIDRFQEVCLISAADRESLPKKRRPRGGIGGRKIVAGIKRHSLFRHTSAPVFQELRYQADSPVT